MQRVCLKSIKSEKESAICCFVNVLYSQTRHGEAVTTAQNIELGELLMQINCHMSCSLLLNGLFMFTQKTSAFLFHSVALMIICHLNLALRGPHWYFYHLSQERTCDVNWHRCFTFLSGAFPVAQPYQSTETQSTLLHCFNH